MKPALTHPRLVLTPLPRHRPPALAPRRRTTTPEIGNALCAWARRAAGASASARVSLSEWTSMDVRATPHVVIIGVGPYGEERRMVVPKRSDLICEADLVTTLQPRADAVAEPAP